MKLSTNLANNPHCKLIAKQHGDQKDIANNHGKAMARECYKHAGAMATNAHSNARETKTKKNSMAKAHHGKMLC